MRSGRDRRVWRNCDADGRTLRAIYEATEKAQTTEEMEEEEEKRSKSRETREKESSDDHEYGEWCADRRAQKLRSTALRTRRTESGAQTAWRELDKTGTIAK